MKLILITLVAVVVGMMVACSSNESMPDIEATVEAIVERELKERAPTDSRPPPRISTSKPSSKPTPKPTPCKESHMFDLGQWQKAKCETDQQWKDRRNAFRNAEQTCERNGGKWEGTGGVFTKTTGSTQYICVPNK